ncbi:fibronectin type III-like domain-contianing protein [Streptococcus moroccensis]|nr:fibronectin type III-like domain-contianing protein [Streptococcus moroccensis]
MPVQYPFGYGLSYTTFSYQDFKVSHKTCLDTDQVEVSVRVTNTGNRAGKEVVQLYVNRQVDSSLRPVRELKGFEKIALEPGESKEVRFTLNKRSFAEYNTLLRDWYVPSGDYVIEIGKDSRNIVLSHNITVMSTQTLPLIIHRNTTLGDLMENPKTRAWTQDLKRKIDAFFHPDGVDQDDAVSDDMGDSIFKNMPLRGVTPFVGMTSNELDAVIKELNEHV